eukprot:TRINITY_DN68676_c0_g1_i1.p1 TRINITY_DN68676_c0_g1~~TRINITY_DN68676_c0_g1_i1.p1  ORF type:complete len:697 (-),score=36.92 TRINITY_DN68676_c0_g1_i1:509-2422(-)
MSFLSLASPTDSRLPWSGTHSASLDINPDLLMHASAATGQRPFAGPLHRALAFLDGPAPTPSPPPSVPSAPASPENRKASPRWGDSPSLLVRAVPRRAPPDLSPNLVFDTQSSGSYTPLCAPASPVLPLPVIDAPTLVESAVSADNAGPGLVMSSLIEPHLPLASQSSMTSLPHSAKGSGAPQCGDGTARTPHEVQAVSPGGVRVASPTAPGSMLDVAVREAQASTASPGLASNSSADAGALERLAVWHSLRAGAHAVAAAAAATSSTSCARDTVRSPLDTHAGFSIADPQATVDQPGHGPAADAGASVASSHAVAAECFHRAGTVYTASSDVDAGAGALRVRWHALVSAGVSAAAGEEETYAGVGGLVIGALKGAPMPSGERLATAFAATAGRAHGGPKEGSDTVTAVAQAGFLQLAVAHCALGLVAADCRRALAEAADRRAPSDVSSPARASDTSQGSPGPGSYGRQFAEDLCGMGLCTGASAGPQSHAYLEPAAVMSATAPLSHVALLEQGSKKGSACLQVAPTSSFSSFNGVGCTCGGRCALEDGVACSCRCSWEDPEGQVVPSVSDSTPSTPVPASQATPSPCVCIAGRRVRCIAAWHFAVAAALFARASVSDAAERLAVLAAETADVWQES